MDDVYYPSQPQYTTASTQQGYPALTSSYAQPSGGLYAGSAHSTDPNYPVGSSSSFTYPSNIARPSDNYLYGNESPHNDPYSQPSGYATTQRPYQGRTPDSENPRQDPRLGARYAQGRDTARIDQDPRAMQPRRLDYDYSRAAGTYADIYAPQSDLPGRGQDSYPPLRAPVYDPYRNDPVRSPEMRDGRDDGRRRR